MSLTELLQPVYENEDIKRFKLGDTAAKLLMRFIESKDHYLSLNAAKKNYRHITSNDAFVICGQLEKMGYLIGKFEKGRLVYKFNDTAERTSLSIPLSQIEAATQRMNEKLAKKVERAAKTIERYKNLGSIVQIVDKKEDEISKDIRLEKELLTKSQDYVPTAISTKTALELHQDRECNPAVCRICAMEQDKEIGFE